MELASWEWLALFVAAFGVGLGKGGLPGLGNFAIAIYALVLPTRLSVGVLLLVLIAADMVAVLVYRKDADWRVIRTIMPWMLLGLLLGTLLFYRIDDRTVEVLIGIILLTMTGLHFTSTYINGKWAQPHADKDSLALKASMGITGGFATMIANAAGPVAAFYLLYIKQPKIVFVGTLAWLFFIINLVKVPLQIAIGNLYIDTIWISLKASIFAIIGVLVARWVIQYVPQKLFEVLVWVFVISAGIHLLL